jgi:hypothetical protein
LNARQRDDRSGPFLVGKQQHQCPTVVSATRNLINSEAYAGELPHIEIGRTRKAQDFRDTLKMLEWFASNNLFDSMDPRLRCIASGVTVSENNDINCDNAEEVGSEIMTKMDNVPLVTWY